MLKPLIIGIARGSGSGKSTVARNVADLLTTSSVAFIDMDAYYKNFPALSLDERKKLNWDHPDAFDYDLLCSHLEALSKRKSIEKPEYDFVTHLRRAERTRVEPADVVVIDGILLFVDAKVRELCDVKVFVDADVIVPRGGHNSVAIEMIVAKIQRRLQRVTDGDQARRTPSAERPAPPART